MFLIFKFVLTQLDYIRGGNYENQRFLLKLCKVKLRSFLFHLLKWILKETHLNFKYVRFDAVTIKCDLFRHEDHGQWF